MEGNKKVTKEMVERYYKETRSVNCIMLNYAYFKAINMLQEKFDGITLNCSANDFLNDIGNYVQTMVTHNIFANTDELVKYSDELYKKLLEKFEKEEANES